MIQLTSDQLVITAFTWSAVAIAAVGGVFWLVTSTIGQRRGSGWARGWLLAALAVALGAGIVRVPVYASWFSLAATMAAILSAFAHAGAGYRFAQNRPVPRSMRIALGCGGLAAVVLWAHFVNDAPLVSPEFALALGALSNAVALFPLCRGGRHRGVRTACALSAVVGVCMLRTAIFSLILLPEGRVLGPIYWAIEVRAATFVAFLLAMTEIVAILDGVRAELEDAAKLDPLTGLLNRYAFYMLQPAFCDTVSQPVSAIAILDLNNLKKINDTFGHAAGDEALCNVAKSLKELVRSTDYVFRWGGDEFVIVLQGVSAETARERLARMPEPPPVSTPEGADIRLAVSWGVAQLGRDVDAALREADAFLYGQKRLVKDASAEEGVTR